MAAIDCLNTLTLPLPQVALTIIKVIQWTRTSTVACSCLLLLLLLLMMHNTWLCHTCQLVDCRLLLPHCRRPVVVATANLASVWKRLLAVMVTAANACCAVSSAIATCHCCYHRRIVRSIYKMRLPVFLSLVALALAGNCRSVVTSSYKKNIVSFVLTASRDEI